MILFVFFLEQELNDLVLVTVRNLGLAPGVDDIVNLRSLAVVLSSSCGDLFLLGVLVKIPYRVFFFFSAIASASSP